MPKVHTPSLNTVARQILTAADLATHDERREHFDEDLHALAVDVPISVDLIETLRQTLSRDGVVILPKIDKCKGCEHNVTEAQQEASDTAACSACLLRHGGAL